MNQIPPLLKTKAELRAERRAVQEAQRAAKCRAGSAAVFVQSPTSTTVVIQTPDEVNQLPEVFFKLPSLRAADICQHDPEKVFTSFCDSLRQYIGQLHQSQQQGGTSSRELDAALKSAFQAFAAGVPLPPNLATLLKQLNWQLSQMSDDSLEPHLRLLEWLEDFTEQSVQLSTDAIAITVTGILKSMNSKPVVLTYLNSSTVAQCLTYAYEQKVDFEMAIIDDVPQGRGLDMLRTMTGHNILCRYSTLNGTGLLLDAVKLVIVGAIGVLANGNVIAPLGTCQIALMAKTENIPILVLCQTYKFCEMVMTSCNEVPWRNCEVLPSELVTGLVTEIRILPCTAVPAVLRVKQPA